MTTRHVPVVFSLALALILGACKPEPYLRISPSSLSFSEDGGTQTVQVSANYPWTVNVSGKGFSVSPSSGEGDGRVTVTASPTDQPNPVSARLTFYCEGLTESVELNQAARNTIMVGNVAKIPAAGGTFEVPVQYNTDFTVEVDADARSWISFVETKALTSGKLVFDVEENTAFDPRTGKVTVKDKSGKAEPLTITLVQEEKKVIMVGNVAKIPAAGGTLEVPVQYNTDFTVEVDADARSWISFVETKALTSGKLVFDVEENTAFDPRTGKVTVKDKSGKAEPLTITLVQEEKKVIEVGDVTEIPAEGGTYEVAVEYNTDFSVEVDPSAQGWISFVKTKALTSGKMVFVFAENVRPDPRSGKVTIRDNDGKVEPVTLTFVQKGTEPYFRVVCPEAESLDYEAGELVISIEKSVNVEYLYGFGWRDDSDEMFDYNVIRVDRENPYCHKMTLPYRQNTTRRVRSGMILFNYKYQYQDGNYIYYMDTLHVYQQPVTIIASEKEVFLPSVASQFSFRVAEDQTDNYRVENDADWIEAVKSQGKKGGAEYVWKAKKNTGTGLREAQIKVYLSGFDEPDVLQVYQEGGDLSVSVTYSGKRKQVKAPAIFGPFAEKSTIWWGDEASIPYSAGASHTYGTSGSHTISVTTKYMHYIERAEVTDLEDGMHIDFSKMRNHNE